MSKFWKNIEWYVENIEQMYIIFKQIQIVYSTCIY